LIPSACGRPGRSCNGFDAFFFCTEPLSRIDLDCEFLFGQPWWDYWFPLAYASAGGRLMTVDAALLFHLDHPQKWNQPQWVANAEKTIGYFKRSTGQLPDDFVAQIQQFPRSTDLSEFQLGPFAYWCFGKLRSMSELIVLPPHTDGGDLLGALLAVLDHRGARALVGTLNVAQASIGALKEEARSKEIEAAQVLGKLNEAQASIGGLKEEARSKEIEAAQVLARLREVEAPRVLISPSIEKENMNEEVKQKLRILTSRKATLVHFIRLNVAWARRVFPGFVRFLSLLREALRSVIGNRYPSS
jgi:hypothetical protein